uniref:Uncharacterized protein n=1 Tax=Salix viminalis TaxID=40686 RepID=A0A6N2KA54_SALVM
MMLGLSIFSYCGITKGQEKPIMFGSHLIHFQDLTADLFFFSHIVSASLASVFALVLWICYSKMFPALLFQDVSCVESGKMDIYNSLFNSSLGCPLCYFSILTGFVSVKLLTFTYIKRQKNKFFENSF